MRRNTIQGLENYFGPIPTAFQINSPYGAGHHYIEPWWVLQINKYQRDNLLMLLRMVLDNDGPFGSMNTGDWVAEIAQMLAKPELSGTRVVPKYNLDEQDIANLGKSAIHDRILFWLADRIHKVDGVSIEIAMKAARSYLDAEG
jgi:hypothetical protein